MVVAKTFSSCSNASLCIFSTATSATLSLGIAFLSPAKLHLEKIVEHGVLSCYRQSFKPVARVLGTYHD
jgi:hypothetical protein